MSSSSSECRPRNLCIDGSVPFSMQSQLFGAMSPTAINLDYLRMRRPRESGEKHHTCSVAGCGKTFYHVQTLYRHQRQKHGSSLKRPRYTSMVSSSSGPQFPEFELASQLDLSKAKHEDSHTQMDDYSQCETETLVDSSLSGDKTEGHKDGDSNTTDESSSEQKGCHSCADENTAL